VAGVVHFVWRVKKDLTEPLVYAGVLALLLALRVPQWLKQWRAARARSARASVS
jgi:methionine sulfoxide reductase heme-binding subunit